MESFKFSDRTIDLTEGDITKQRDVDAVVNAANAELSPGGGVAGAIHRVAGPELSEECRPHAPIRPGESVVTGAHGLPNRWVVHTLGPVYGVDEPAPELLAACYRNSLELAEVFGATSIAFPAISTGAFGYPLREAANIATRTVAETIVNLEGISRARFVLFDASAVRAHRAALETM